MTPFYPASQILLELRGTEPEVRTPQSVMENVIARFEPERTPPDDAAVVREIYRDLLSRNAAFLILDNARDTGQVAPLLPPPPSAAIVTARAMLDLPGVVACRLDCPRADAVAVRGASCRARSLARGVRRAGLGLRRPSAVAASRGLPAGAALGADRDRRLRGADRGEPRDAAVRGRETDVMAAVGPSLELLSAQDAELAERWRDLAARTQDAVCHAIAQILGTLTATECRNYLAEAGYDRISTHRAVGATWRS